MNWLAKRPGAWSRIKKVDLLALDKAPVVDFSI